MRPHDLWQPKRNAPSNPKQMEQVLEYGNGMILNSKLDPE